MADAGSDRSGTPVETVDSLSDLLGDAGAGAEVAIAAVVAAKGVIRFPEISQDSTGEKAEEFLIGSVSSWILAALVSMLIRVVSMH